MSRAVRLRRTLVVAGLALLVIVVVAIALLATARVGAPVAAPTPTATVPPSTPAPTFTPTPSPVTPTTTAPPAFDRAALSIDDPSSLWVVSNKQRPLAPVDFVPPDLVDVPVAHTNPPLLRQEASNAFVALVSAARQEAGLALASNSAYRSYDAQVRVYDNDVATNGQAFADTSTARPGHSEHQTGLAIDIGPESGACAIATCLADLPEGQWLAANAWRFGFILRYPADKTDVTGFAFEPWHYRYVGVPLATEMHDTGVTTLEEFFGLPAAPGY